MIIPLLEAEFSDSRVKTIEGYRKVGKCHKVTDTYICVCVYICTYIYTYIHVHTHI
jgi:hypothetical protein